MLIVRCQENVMEIRSGRKSVMRRYGFRSSGNINHARYDHKQRAREIHVVCPKCSHMAIAIDMEASPDREIVGDLDQSWKASPFDVTCTNCNYQAQGLSYADLPEPFHQVWIGREILWAYNWRHLDLIIKVLGNKPIVGHPFRFFSTYVHGAWKKNPKAWLLAVQEHVAQNDARHLFASRYHRSKLAPNSAHRMC
jgi:hypothetical protein